MTNPRNTDSLIFHAFNKLISREVLQLIDRHCARAPGLGANQGSRTLGGASGHGGWASRAAGAVAALAIAGVGAWPKGQPQEPPGGQL